MQQNKTQAFCEVCKAEVNFKIINEGSGAMELVCGQCGRHIKFVNENFEETEDKLLIE